MSGQLLIVDQVDSTNLAVRKIFSNLADGSLFCAIEQTAGRGRLNRRWVTQPGSAVCASGVFKNVQQPFHAGAILALAALELIQDKTGDSRAYFKWPNDIYIREKKLAGILSEGIFSGGTLSGVISGIGININQSRETLDQLDNAATSLFCECGRNFDLTELYQEFFVRFQRFYQQYLADPQTIVEQWISANKLLGKRLTALRPDGSKLSGIFSEILPDGAMIITCDSTAYRFDCGDIKIDPAALPF